MSKGSQLQGDPSEPEQDRPRLPAAAIAVHVLEHAGAAAKHGLISIAASDRRAEEVARILRILNPEVETLLFPAWDCVPYDRVSPSREAMGRRVAVLRRLAEDRGAPPVVVTSPAALMQRVPPREIWPSACLLLRAGDSLDLDRLRVFLEQTGYFIDTRVDEPGEAAIRGTVIDIFPAAAVSPCRIEHSNGQIIAIRSYDSVSQRTLGDMHELLIEPASEAILTDSSAERFPGMEHRLAQYYPKLQTVFDYLPAASVLLDEGAESRRTAFLDLVRDAYRSRDANGGVMPTSPAPHPDELYLTEEDWKAALAQRQIREAQSGPAAQPVPNFALEANPGDAFARFAAGRLETGERVVLATGSEPHARRLNRMAERRLGRAPKPVKDWSAILRAPKASLLSLTLDVDEGFADAARRITLIPAAAILGAGANGSTHGAAPAEMAPGEVELHIGDAVVHMEHGLAALRGLETMAIETTALGEVVRLEYAEGATLSVPVEAMDRIWRYSSDPEAVALDRLGGDAWPKRRSKVEAAVRQTAARLCEFAAERNAVKVSKLVPPRRAYERFVARFPFSETPDQESAIDQVLEDLASGRPMNRLVCGDVGFGKTEVALRAAAAVALAGRQVVLAAPTTVLARQHFQTFQRRFAGLGPAVGHLSRLSTPGEARGVKEAVADGSMRILVGTHAVAGKGVRFKDLGLLIIDEEQRFGAEQKSKLRELGRDVHVLTMTATPIPRTLQSALIGLQELSIIATPPARRQPIRTFLSPFDPVTLREALLREKMRGGQSFVVCPRIEDIEPLAQQLSDAVPELDTKIAHGRLPPGEIDSVMVDFAGGRGDLLLATNIVESGLDIPRANTIAIWRPDRFGLSQLHQLRGRVGRGRMRGICYLLTDPKKRLARKTEERLRALQGLDRLGAGFAISARDLDLRGAGDLFGKEQAGHMKLIGIGLYQHLFERALLEARGVEVDEDWAPELNIDAPGVVPEDYIPEPEVRMNIYARLARLGEDDTIEAIGEEIEDRFGPLPHDVRHLLMRARVKLLCRRLGIARIDGGPQGIAITFRDGRPDESVVQNLQAKQAEAAAWRGEKLVLRRASSTAIERLQGALDILQSVGGGGGAPKRPAGRRASGPPDGSTAASAPSSSGSDRRS